MAVGVGDAVGNAVGVSDAIGDAVAVKVASGGSARLVEVAVAVTLLGSGITGRVAGSRLQVTEPAATHPMPAPSASRT